ncbi:integrase [Pectobacterium brasiliense]|uniref:tyrosine-type recombinase/integrase n=1 Tax=Pectobacterium brasiliense TaxID=180957 RepID=UPI0001A444C2|nr:site-specific integrase [Pectobacterium brasiliense]KGA24946.1 integrase [Pectobacterium brasiliense]KRF62891.1 integrase [Pectobacterium brasiliense]MBN3186100.1 site-specific integrase [Pectobacterium brasiliense]QHG26930.1 tyrosine-type recombinase/integrase [Pectobacterium brasiliense]
MPIYRRGKTYWVDISTPDGERIRRSAGTTERAKAQEYHDKLKHEVWQVARIGKIADRTFEELIILALRDAEDQSCFENKQIYARYWLTVFDGRIISSISGEEITNKLPTHSTAKNCKLSNATRNRYRAFIIRALSLAVKSGWIRNMPYTSMQREPKVRVRWIEKSQARALIESLRLDWMKRVVSFALLTGARKGEIFSLKWDSVNLSRRIAIVTADNAKSGRARPLPLNDDAVKIINACGRDSDYVFSANGVRIVEINRTDFCNALRISGIADFRFHDLRHTWASWHVQNGTPLMTLKELGGWEKLEMVNKYAHLSTEHLRQFSGIVTFLAQSDTEESFHPSLSVVNI